MMPTKTPLEAIGWLSTSGYQTTIDKDAKNNSEFPIGAVITKGYFVVEADGRKCRAEITTTHLTSDGGYEPDQEPCDSDAFLCINIRTSTMKGKRITSKIGFCKPHIPRRYKEWFSLPLLDCGNET